ncbi:MAG: arabinan endo-1,5-alpha-L-arabinosidase [Planctomycetaceae bacterium]|jgi:arabinan endo-1,5-alpha-L-arabinosidase|nr:arabinan endo-1,5-alpha-L-arabinosidase [Planctomycetaceae bacterium]
MTQKTTFLVYRFLVPLCLCLAMPIIVQSASPGKAVIPYDTPDPTAVLTPDEKGLYVFSTGRGIPISYSTNLIDWERTDRVFDVARFPNGMPDWAQKAIPGSRGLWAPDVVFLNGKYYVYYSVSTFGSQRSAIGLATNKTLDKTSPDYEWKDEGMVLESHPDHTDYNAIDSALFVDDDGKAYLYWGSYWTGLKGVEVDPKTGKPFRYAPGELKIPADYVSVASRTGNDTSIEAAFVVRHGKYYYLFTSRGSCCSGLDSTYHMAIGRSEKPLGPYVDKNNVRMDKGGGDIWLTKTEKWIGPGHNGFFRTTKEGKNKGDWIILHAYDSDEPKSGRLSQIRPLYWSESDEPILGEILDVPLEQFDFSTKKN